MYRSITLLVLSGLVGCGTSADSLDARSELILSTTSGAEEALVSARVDGGEAPTEDPDQPPLFRECDAEGTFVGLFASYDADSDGELGPPEEDAVEEARGERGPDDQVRAEQRMHFLGLVYDVDQSKSIDGDELTALFDDFTARCEAIDAQLLADFDADGDGVLSEEEMATAEAAVREKMDEMRAEGPPECDRGEGEGPGAGEGEGGPGGAERGPSEGGEPDPSVVPPPMAEYDTDGDGLWSDSELAGMREAVRALIRSGAPLGGPPPVEEE